MRQFRNHPMKALTVLSTSGEGVVTNTEGYYGLRFRKDSIWFSYLN
ncbi:MAG: hypothetical protein IPI78_18035 [Chitinophagaceae bacterium]|nr:hypothetical protein [Chitinophagaceae bacterium]